MFFNVIFHCLFSSGFGNNLLYGDAPSFKGAFPLLIAPIIFRKNTTEKKSLQKPTLCRQTAIVFLNAEFRTFKISAKTRSVFSAIQKRRRRLFSGYVAESVKKPQTCRSAVELFFNFKANRFCLAFSSDFFLPSAHSSKQSAFRVPHSAGLRRERRKSNDFCSYDKRAERRKNFPASARR